MGLWNSEDLGKSFPGQDRSEDPPESVALPYLTYSQDGSGDGPVTVLSSPSTVSLAKMTFLLSFNVEIIKWPAKLPSVQPPRHLGGPLGSETRTFRRPRSRTGSLGPGR